MKFEYEHCETGIPIEDLDILIAAVKKAVKNGYKRPVLFSWEEEGMNLNVDMRVVVYAEIFSHDFAKAFWGEETDDICRHDGQIIQVPHWQHHLQEMVLEEEPLKYLEKFL